MEDKLCNTIQEFEDIFGNVPFKDLDKIKKYIKNNFIPISFIEKKKNELKEVLDFAKTGKDEYSKGQASVLERIIKMFDNELLDERRTKDV